MIVCTSCGHENDDSDEFCGSCGDYLEWSGEGELDEQTLDATAATPPEAAEEAPYEQVEARVGPDDRAAADEQARADAEEQARVEADERARVRAEERARRKAEERAQAEAEEVALVAERARAEATAQAEAQRVIEAEVAARKAAEAANRKKAAARSKARAEAQAKADEESRAKRAAQATADRSRGVKARAAAQAEADARAEEERRARADAEANAAAEAREREAQEAERAAREEAEAAAREQAAAHQRAEAEAARAEEEAARAAEAVRRASALVARPPASSAATRPAGAPRARRPARSTPDPEGSDVATGPVAPGRPTQPSARQLSSSPEARKPGRPKRDQAPVRPPAPPRTIQPGDLICGQCGEGNDPSRKFCRRCGASLVQAAVAPEPSWWRRLLKRRRAPVKAGDRPGRQSRSGGRALSGMMRKAVGILAALGLLGITLAAIGPWRDSVTGGADSAFDSVRRRISPKYEPVRPSSAIASSSLPNHDPKMAIDGISNSYWAEGAQGDGEGQQLVLRFDRPVDLDRIGILTGASRKPEDFLAQPRPERLHLVFSDGSTADVSIKDSAGFQTFTIKARQATTVEVQIKSVYKALGGKDLAITEIELFTKA